MIRVEEAWGLLRREKGAKAGAEAQGIMIAHIDTGYRRHPEVWMSIPEQSGHQFHGKADTDSISFRTPIPFESGQ